MDTYTLTQISSKKIELEFKDKHLSDAFARFEFCSRLLHSLKPNIQGYWEQTSTPRINAFIHGFPKEIIWQQDGKKFMAESVKIISDEYIKQLKNAIKGIEGEKKNEFSKPMYSFTIEDINEKKEYDYSFTNRSRAVVAFCVLWDGEDHSRNHLEVSLAGGKRTYGDPSKTVDELRNEGFPRQTDQSPRGTSISITRKDAHGTKQEHYQLIVKEQSLIDQVGRSNIPKKYKIKLYESSTYTCNNCGEKFPFEYLAPDHRVPSIVQADNLTKDNFQSVLQTLCVRCNQVKREACKKCPYEHKCDKCAWAFPERHGLSKENLLLLKTISERNHISINDLVSITFTS